MAGETESGTGNLALSFPHPHPDRQGCSWLWDCLHARRGCRGSPGKGPEHGHQGAMGIFAVLQGVIKGNSQGLPIHVQIHPFAGDSHQSRCGDLWTTAVVVGIGGNCFPVVVIHMAADAVTDSGGEGIGSHGAGSKSPSFHPAPTQACHLAQTKLSSLNPLKLT